MTRSNSRGGGELSERKASVLPALRPCPTVRLTMDVPSRLAEQLAAGELDVALIPSVEYLRGVDRGLRDLPGFAIAARGPVRSVKLFSRVPFGADRAAGARRRLADQPGAGAGLARRAARRPARGRSSRCRWACPVAESTADAVLVIGDRAMTVPDEPFHAVVDLAEAWQALTGPAVRLRPLGGAGGGRPRRPARGPGAEPGARGWPTPTTWRRARAAARTRRRDLLRLPDARPLVRPRRAGARRPAAVRPDGRPAGPGPGRSEPCLPPSPRSCSAPLRAAA